MVSFLKFTTVEMSALDELPAKFRKTKTCISQLESTETISVCRHKKIVADFKTCQEDELDV